ncbi:hypothetical protein [Ottowia testudinis]|uniref:Uncharacterized protein n=1 Tax=Ottowia testudinis TaxID=2816950 RepID=A0A975CKY2_9BURK|nr:hypothetical protein [Ottowia testudinis]QTD47514.1 hypothetical protein J1M35_14810 [Ottowia testudinis]
MRTFSKTIPKTTAPTRSLTPSPLGRTQPVPMDAEQVKRQGWREQHILVIAQDDARLDFLERQLITSIGERLYGERQPSKGGGVR